MSIFNKSPETNGDSTDHRKKDVVRGRTGSGSDTSGEISIVGRGVRIEGDIHVDGDVRVGGRINGDVHVEGRIVVASEGVIRGAIRAGAGDIAGNVEGDIVVVGRLVIRQTASIVGQMVANILIVEQGAAINGLCRIGKIGGAGKGAEQIGNGAAKGMPTLLPFQEGGSEGISEGRKQIADSRGAGRKQIADGTSAGRKQIADSTSADRKQIADGRGSRKP